MSRRSEWINGLKRMPGILGDGLANPKPFADAFDGLPKRTWSNDPYAVLLKIGHIYPRADRLPDVDVPITMMPAAEALPVPTEIIHVATVGPRLYKIEPYHKRHRVL